MRMCVKDIWHVAFARPHLLAAQLKHIELTTAVDGGEAALTDAAPACKRKPDDGMRADWGVSIRWVRRALSIDACAYPL